MTLAFVALAAAVWFGLGQSRAVAGHRAFEVGTSTRSAAVKVPAAEAAWLPLVLDLCAAGLLAGQPLDVALAAAAPVQLPWLSDRLRQVAAMLRLGADPSQAWQPLAGEPRLRPVAVTAIRSAASGIRLAAALTDLASELRASARAAALARAERAGVWVIAPLGLCYLPAFVCLGVVPVVIGIAESLR